MKKLIALTLMVACLACFSLGCPAKKDTKPVTTPNTTSAPADDTAADDKPAE